MQGTSSSGSDKIIPDTRDYFRWLPCRLICLYSEMICCEEYFWLLGGLFLFFFLFCFVFVVLLFGFDFLKFYFIILFTGTNKIYITIYIWRKFCFTHFFFYLFRTTNLNHSLKLLPSKHFSVTTKNSVLSWCIGESESMPFSNSNEVFSLFW